MGVVIRPATSCWSRCPRRRAIELREWRGGDGPHYADWQPEVEGAVRTG
ncbi:MAG: hypothetical protein OXC99_09320 [Chloroflexi bacterium]|nr:hypothetical protein [Chloroflexota bacterium]